MGYTTTPLKESGSDPRLWLQSARSVLARKKWSKGLGPGEAGSNVEHVGISWKFNNNMYKRTGNCWKRLSTWLEICHGRNLKPVALHSPAAFLMGGASFAQTFVWEEKPSNAAWQDMIVVCHLCMWFEYEDQLSTLKMSKEHWLCGKSLDWWQLIESFKSSNPSDFTMRLKIRWAEPQRIGWCGIEVRWCFGFSKAEPILDHAMCFATCGDLNTAFVGWWFWMYFSAEGQNGNSKYHLGALLEVCGILWKNHGIGLHINW